jgi:hypothetical protein
MVTQQSAAPAPLTEQETIRSVSYGGGRQSTALLVLAAQGLIDFPLFIFANTGVDSEHPATLAYLEQHAQPYAAAHGIELVEVHKTYKGKPEGIHERIMRPGIVSQIIPVRSSADGPPMSRSCTVDYKIEQIGKELRSRGASPENPATVAVGISLDEMHRANRKNRPYERIVYPLLRMDDGPLLDRPMRTDDCIRVIRNAGLPVPPKSACFFCPFHSMGEWIRQRRDEPELFAKSVEVERTISAKAGEPRYLTRTGLPLDQAVPEGVEMLPFLDDTDADCETGACMT